MRGGGPILPGRATDAPSDAGPPPAPWRRRPPSITGVDPPIPRPAPARGAGGPRRGPRALSSHPGWRGFRAPGSGRSPQPPPWRAAAERARALLASPARRRLADGLKASGTAAGELGGIEGGSAGSAGSAPEEVLESLVGEPGAGTRRLEKETGESLREAARALKTRMAREPCRALRGIQEKRPAFVPNPRQTYTRFSKDKKLTSAKLAEREGGCGSPCFRNPPSGFD